MIKQQDAKTFITGFIQVYFVIISTYMVSKEIYTGVFVSSFAISYVWTLNVKVVAFGTWCDRFIYATGAAFGAIAGLASSAMLFNLFNLLINKTN